MDGVHIRTTRSGKPIYHLVLILVVMDGVHIPKNGKASTTKSKVLILVVMDGVHIHRLFDSMPTLDRS